MENKALILGTIHYLAEFDEINMVITVPFDNELTLYAIQSGNKILEKQDLFIEKLSMNWVWGMQFAARCFNRDFFEFFIIKGAVFLNVVMDR